MSGILEALERLARTGTLLVAVDFDGTLAEIVARPEDAVPVAGAMDALADMARLARTEVVVISGRTVPDLAQRTRGPSGVTLIGGHGAEWDARTSPHPMLSKVAGEVEEVAARYDRAVVERKPSSVTVHTRAMDPSDAALIAEDVHQVGEQLGLRVETGKAVVEIHLTDFTKGTALDELRRRIGADAVLYLGDDTTDEEAFDALTDADVGIKVGDGPSLARWRVDGPAEAVRVLESLAAFRRVQVSLPRR